MSVAIRLEIMKLSTHLSGFVHR